MKPTELNLGVDATGAVDLDKIDCRGCKHRGADESCRRFPPVFRPPMPTIVNGTAQLVPGGWIFPPAALKCGEFRRFEDDRDAGTK